VTARLSTFAPRRFRRPALLAPLALLAAAPVALRAQTPAPPSPAPPPPAPGGVVQPLGPGTRRGEPRFQGGVGLNVAQPVHEFRDFVKNGVGFGAHALYRLGAEGAFALRGDFGLLTYGRENRRVSLLPTTGRITADLTTTNNIFWFGVGPHLMAPSGPVRPYANAGFGFAVFSTSTTLRARDSDEELANDTNQSDFTWAGGGGGGLLLPVSRNQRQIAFIDLGARFHRNGRVRYLRKGGIVDLPNGGSRFDVIESPADLWTFHIGLTLGAR
jgi:opacity protein-like surface antigen